MILFYVLGFILFIALIGYFFLFKDKLKDQENLKNHWQKFLKVKSLNYISGINVYGTQLIYNKFLLTKQLEEIISVVNSRISDFPELKKLKEAAFNKKLHYNRTLNYPGSNGG
ncbi:hypothetical protein [uncultured Winogradskyella sp.]|uniref:hypothetical protein n=1 Tax=uncultured Winogradskyella sp. TaxID=395353 RepID=UPI0030EB4B9C|tara:strand:+ start:795 stop:1133 length:339 start_codon:yes stop_codon:yes gene_type:complete